MAIFASAFLCLALNVYKEARSEPFDAMVAVAQVTINRGKLQNKDLCDIVFAKKQFSWTNKETRDGKVLSKFVPDFNEKAWAQSLQAALSATRTSDATRGALFYHRYDVRPYWSYNMQYAGRWGAHVFYRRYA
jgi:spore germination cell wall hydrolase CwlJ-like protein